MNGRLLIGSAIGLVLGVGAGWLSASASVSEREGTAEELASVELERDAVATEKDTATAELETVTRRVARLDRDLNAARTALAAAEKQLEEARAAALTEAAGTTGELEDGSASGLGEGQAFSSPEYDEHLATVNWTDVGRHVGAMAPMLAEIIAAVSTGEQPSPEAIGGVQRHNGPLVTVAMTMHGKLPGETVNGAFSHPSAVVNMIVTTLAAMGQPLDKAQLAALGRVGSDFVAEDERRRQGYDENTLALRRHAEESLLKGRFYEAAMDVLTEEQHTALRPEVTRGRVTADLFSASLVWVGRARPVPFRDREHLAEILGERIGRDLDLEGGARDRWMAMVSDWVQGLPYDMLRREPDALWLRGLVPIDAIDFAAKHQLVLMDRMLSELDLSEEAVRELRDHVGAFVPTWRPE